MWPSEEQLNNSLPELFQTWEEEDNLHLLRTNKAAVRMCTYDIVDLTGVGPIFGVLDVAELCGVDENGSGGRADGQEIMGRCRRGSLSNLWSTIDRLR